MNRRIVITGASSGLGLEICHALIRQTDDVIINVDCMPPPYQHNCSHYVYCDLKDSSQIQLACNSIGPVDILINCAGINEISWLEDLALRDWDNVMDINARAIYLMTKGLLPELVRSKGTILNIVSNASHMPMTGSLAYNASKGAAHIMTLQLARELTRRYGITVFGISPNKLAGTYMSRYIEQRVPVVRGWTPEYAEQYQRQSILCGEETNPATLARFIAYLLQDKQDHKYLSGCILPYGA